MDAKTQAMLDRRLARVEGQVSGVRRMVAEGRYCLDVLTQLSAARAALDQLGAELIASHLKTCVLGHGTETEHAHCEQMSQDELLDELRVALSRFMK